MNLKIGVSFKNARKSAKLLQNPIRTLQKPRISSELEPNPQKSTFLSIRAKFPHRHPVDDTVSLEIEMHRSVITQMKWPSAKCCDEHCCWASPRKLSVSYYCNEVNVVETGKEGERMQLFLNGDSGQRPHKCGFSFYIQHSTLQFDKFVCGHQYKMCTWPNVL